MKRFHILLILSGISYFLFLLLKFPSTIILTEGDDLFLLSKEFIGNVLSRQQGFTTLLTDFIEQFYATAWVGALIYTIILCLSAEFIYLALRNLKKESLYWAAFIPAPIILAIAFPYSGILLNFLLYALALFVFTAIKSKVGRTIYVLLMPIPAFCLMPWYQSMFLFISFCALEYICYQNKITSAIMLVALLFSFIVPRLWSDFVDFVQFDERPFAGMFTGMRPKIIALSLFTSVALAFPVTKKLPNFIGYIVSPLVIAAFITLMVTNKNMTLQDRINKVSILADNHDWEGIIAEVPYEEAVNSYILTRYVLMAMNATGSLGQTLFAYPINSPEMFLYRHRREPVYVNFNRQFYDNIEIWDEAFHEAFEYGVTQRENDCFKSLRKKTDYAINAKDFGVAKYYLNLLSSSLMNKKFVAERTAKIGELEKIHTSGYDTLRPNRSDTFVGAYPMASEMFRLYDRNKKSVKLFDYLLCSLLLNKEVDKFAIVLEHFGVYKNRELPRSYAEALAALASKDSAFAHRAANYDHKLDKYYVDFISRASQKQDVSEYALTYWAYLYFREVAPLPDYNE